MEKVFNLNVNEFIFGRTKPEKKLEVLDNLNGADLRKVTNATIVRIYKECGDKVSEKFWIKSDRREGNRLGHSSGFWNSYIEYIGVCKGQAYIGFYVQNSSTDWGESVNYDSFKYGSEYYGYCKHLKKDFHYDYNDVNNVIRCILKEYVYWKYIEKPERVRKQRLESVGGWKVVSPVFNYFYKKWDCWHRMEYNESLRKAYNAGKDAVEKYTMEHVNELYGKPEEELQAIYKEVFQKAANW